MFFFVCLEDFVVKLMPDQWDQGVPSSNIKRSQAIAIIDKVMCN